MKVLFICAEYPLPVKDRRGKRLINIMKQLKKQGHALYFTGFSEKTNPDKNPLFETLSLYAPTPASGDFRQHAEPAYKEKIKGEILSLKPDALFAYGIEAARYVPFEAKLPALADFRRCEYIVLQRENEKSGFLKKLTGAVEWSHIASVETALASKFSTVFLPTERDRYYLTKQSTLDITVLPEAIDTEKYDISEWNPDPERLLFTGSVMEEGNLQAVKNYRDRFGKDFFRRGVSLYVTGKFDEAHKKSVFCEYVRPMGFMKDIREAYANAQAVVIPISGGIGARGKITEAMACGVPVISTKDGAEGLRLTGSDECILIANTPEEMLAAWEKLQDRAYADELRKNARRFVEENYSWNANGIILADELKRALK
ncbi:MAG: glycosyltransferase [Abditibacteriota bacterium]|nr:glycosyltransferase [Abditibacteriota bacterium]